MKTFAIMLALLLAYALYQFRLSEKRNPEKLTWWGVPVWMIYASDGSPVLTVIRFWYGWLHRQLLDIRYPLMRYRFVGDGSIRFLGPAQEAFYGASQRVPVFVEGFEHHVFLCPEAVIHLPDLYATDSAAYEVDPESWTRRWGMPGNDWREIPKDDPPMT